MVKPAPLLFGEEVRSSNLTASVSVVVMMSLNSLRRLSELAEKPGKPSLTSCSVMARVSISAKECLAMKADLQIPWAKFRVLGRQAK